VRCLHACEAESLDVIMSMGGPSGVGIRPDELSQIARALYFRASPPSQRSPTMRVYRLADSRFKPASADRRSRCDPAMPGRGGQRQTKGETRRAFSRDLRPRGGGPPTTRRHEAADPTDDFVE